MAILFVVFAGYLFDGKESMAMMKMRLEMSEQRFTDLNAELEAIRHRMTVQQIQVVPSPGGMTVQLPVATAPAAPAAAMPVGTAVPGIALPPAAAPTAGPEVPAKP